MIVWIRINLNAFSIVGIDNIVSHVLVNFINVASNWYVHAIFGALWRDNGKIKIQESGRVGIESIDAMKSKHTAYSFFQPNPFSC